MKNGNNLWSNDENIVDLSSVSPQTTFLASCPEKPLADSTLYIRRFTTTQMGGLQDHTIVGVKIVFQKGNQNGLWEALHVDRATTKLDPLNPKVATKSVLICCDALEVHGELSLPEADISIFARKLIWADSDAAINTSPLEWSVPAKDASPSTPGQNGANGRNAGSFTVFLSEVVTLSPGKKVRLIANGGKGQDPGKGLKGKDGESVSYYQNRCFEYRIQAFGITLTTHKADVSFAPSAIKIDWKWFNITDELIDTGTIGKDTLPTNGADAIAPGTPGNGGDGGRLCTNLQSIIDVDASEPLERKGGTAGKEATKCDGGIAGKPNSCAKYTIKFHINSFFNEDNVPYKIVSQSEEHKTINGNDKGPYRASNGQTHRSSLVNTSNAWLHPLSTQKALEYARDLFIAGERVALEELLQVYNGALASEDPPANHAWEEYSKAQWTAAQTDVATMLNRLHRNLDYFGNGAGYTPFLSLPATVALYESEIKWALRVMLLSAWIDDKEREAMEAANVLEETIKSLNDDSRRAAQQVTDSGDKIDDVNKRINVLENQLNEKSEQLKNLQNVLLEKSKGDLQLQHAIKFSIKVAAAICQVIPVSQPALGVIAKLADVAADLTTGEPDVPNALSKMGDVLTKAKESADKAKEAALKAQKYKKPEEKKEAENNAMDWGAFYKMGPFLSNTSEAIKALQVPKSEVEAELQKLESQSKEWNTLTDEIRKLNDKKVALFADFTDAYQSLGEGYERISSNATALVSMYQERAKLIGKLDPIATGFVKQMGQRSRLTLLKYLYLMVKSYETTVLKPISNDVDWKLDNVTEKIAALVKPDGGFDVKKLNQNVKALKSLFEVNMKMVRDKLLDEFPISEKTLTLNAGLSSEQTDRLLDNLNTFGYAGFNPIETGLVLRDRQLERLSGVRLTRVKFDPNKPQLGELNNLIVSLKPAHTGAMRKDAKIYSVYSDEPLTWDWTVHPDKIDEGKRSEAAKDILDLILGEGGEKIRGKVALPPVWSDMIVNIQYSPPLPPEKKPTITELYFEFDCDVSPAPENQRVLTVRSVGSTGGAIIECSKDIAGRENGFDQMVRIYERNTEVTLNVPFSVGGAMFDHWVLNGSEIEQGKTQVKITLDTHVFAECFWKSTTVTRIVPADLPIRYLPIRIEAFEQATAIGFAPSLKDTGVVEEGKDGWKLVNYRGIVGWIKDTG